MGPHVTLGLTAAILGLITACSPTSHPPAEAEPRFHLTVEEAGFLAKGELFRIYGEAADPVIIEVTAAEADIEGQPGWQLDTVVHILVDGQVEERRWRFRVGLDPDGFPAVLHGEETDQGSAWGARRWATSDPAAFEEEGSRPSNGSRLYGREVTWR